VIQLEGVAKAYQKAGRVTVHALRGVDLTIGDGEMVAVLGPSGSGTSTLMNILGCMDVPTTGRYLLDGTDVAALSRRQLAEIRSRKIGFVFQSSNLISDATVMGNVELPLIYMRARVRRESAQRALERVGLEGRQDDLPVELFAAQRQKVVIARALINNPVILLDDEPASGLDHDSSIEIMGLFAALNSAGCTVVFATHEEEIAAFAKRVVRLQDGRIVSDQAVTNRAPSPPCSTGSSADGP